MDLLCSITRRTSPGRYRPKRFFKTTRTTRIRPTNRRTMRLIRASWSNGEDQLRICRPTQPHLICYRGAITMEHQPYGQETSNGTSHLCPTSQEGRCQASTAVSKPLLTVCLPPCTLFDDALHASLGYIYSKLHSPIEDTHTTCHEVLKRNIHVLLLRLWWIFWRICNDDVGSR